MVQRGPHLSTRRMASRIGISRMQVWRTLHEEDLYPYHDQRVHPETGDHAQRMDLCHWIKAHPKLLSVILFSDEASFTRDSVNNLRNVHTWSHNNPHETSVTNFQKRFLWMYGVVCLETGCRTFCVSQQFNWKQVWSLPEEWVTMFVGRHPVNDKGPNVLPTWCGSPTLHSARERLLRWILP